VCVYIYMHALGTSASRDLQKDSMMLYALYLQHMQAYTYMRLYKLIRLARMPCVCLFLYLFVGWFTM